MSYIMTSDIFIYHLNFPSDTFFTTKRHLNKINNHYNKIHLLQQELLQQK